MPPAAIAIPSLDEIRSHPVVARGDTQPVVELGLDLSSSAVGWAVSVDREHLTRGKFVFPKTAGMGLKVKEFFTFLREVFRHFRPHRIVLEKPVMRHGSSTARHNEMLAIVRLAAVEAGVGEILDENMVPPQTIKRCLKVPKGQNHEENKQNMLKLINQRLGIHLRWHKSNKAESDDDIADAIAALETIWVLDEERKAPPSTKKKAKRALKGKKL
jgi:Holliday junction resolvasome RuvABC endonuclease subunit